MIPETPHDPVETGTQIKIIFDSDSDQLPPPPRLTGWTLWEKFGYHPRFRDRGAERCRKEEEDSSRFRFVERTKTVGRWRLTDQGRSRSSA